MLEEDLQMLLLASSSCSWCSSSISPSPTLSDLSLNSLCEFLVQARLVYCELWGLGCLAIYSVWESLWCWHLSTCNWWITCLGVCKFLTYVEVAWVFRWLSPYCFNSCMFAILGIWLICFLVQWIKIMVCLFRHISAGFVLSRVLDRDNG